MPEDVGGSPFPDGWEPDDDHDHGVPDEEFASVVLNEAFVRAAVVHEPTAVERLLAAARARAEASEAEARRARGRTARGDRPRGSGPAEHGFGLDADLGDLDGTDDADGRHGPGWAYGRPVRWHRPVAWMLALVMGVGMVALAFSAVYRSASADSGDQAPPPASTGLEQGVPVVPSASADYSQPAVPAVPRGR